MTSLNLFSAKNLLVILPLFLSLPYIISCLVYLNPRVLRSCGLFFSFLNHRADDFSLCLRSILCPWGIDDFSLNIGLPVHLLNWYTSIGMNCK